MNLGDKIRQLRAHKRCSLRKLAEAAGISPSLLSQIETGKVDPSLSTLRKIALGLDAPLFYFVMDEPAPVCRVIRGQQRRSVVFPEAGLAYEILHSDLTKKMGIHVGTLAAGGMTSEEPLPHAGEECVVVLEGILALTVGEEVYELAAGDSIYFDSSIPHRLYNRQDSPCRFYLIITPPKF